MFFQGIAFPCSVALKSLGATSAPVGSNVKKPFKNNGVAHLRGDLLGGTQLDHQNTKNVPMQHGTHFAFSQMVPMQHGAHLAFARSAPTQRGDRSEFREMLLNNSIQNI